MVLYGWLSWSHPKFGSYLASCSYDGSVKIFSISKEKSYTVVYTYTGHNSSGTIIVLCLTIVNCLEWAPPEYGAALATASSDGNVAILYKANDTEWNSQQVVVCRMGCNAVSWCPYRPSSKETGSVLRVAVAAGDSCVHILKCFISPSNPWDLETKLRGHGDRVRDVSWCPFIGITTNRVASCGRVWILSHCKE